MNKFLLSFFLISSSCNTGNLKIIADLPKTLNEASGIEKTIDSDLIWMLNDGGNSPKLYGVSISGKIKKELKINAKNNDWEDLTSDQEGNIYIGDFGNNANKRKNLAILKVSKDSLENKGEVNIERISFKYENQTKFPPKKKNLYFDCEAFFHFNDSLYLFTKSRVKNDFGKTNLYRIPAKQGHDFLSGNAKEFPLNHNSQKESICFENENTLYITDEKAHGMDGNLYEFEFN